MAQQQEEAERAGGGEGRIDRGERESGVLGVGEARERSPRAPCHLGPSYTPAAAGRLGDEPINF